MSNIFRRFMNEVLKEDPPYQGQRPPPDESGQRPEPPPAMRRLVQGGYQGGSGGQRPDPEVLSRAFEIASVKTGAFGGGRLQRQARDADRELAQALERLKTTRALLSERNFEIDGLKTERQELIDIQLELQKEIKALQRDNQRLQAVIEGRARDRNT